jgi:hypothetical protein
VDWRVSSRAARTAVIPEIASKNFKRAFGKALSAFAVPLVWVANTWGFVDLLNGVRGVLQLNVPSFNLATFWYVYTFYAPLVVVSHLMIFWVLIKSRFWKK